MLEPKFFEEAAAKMASNFSEMIAATPVKDFEKNARALLATAFAKLDLVSREEFEVQRDLLAQANERLTQLEARIAELEAGNQQ